MKTKYTVVFEYDNERTNKVSGFKNKTHAERLAQSAKKENGVTDAYVIEEQHCHLTLALLRKQGWNMRSKDGLILEHDEDSDFTSLKVFCGYGIPAWLKKHDSNPYIDYDGYATIDTFENKPDAHTLVTYTL
ncbi:MAG: hypothetical protein MdMp024_0948 [Bacteroidales bacterium]